mgnify:CR=1 FL=1
MSEADGSASVVRTVRICNPRGLHARAAAKFVKCAGTFSADVTVAREGTSVSGLSIMGLMMLAAANGSEIEIRAAGSDAAAASAALCKLVEAGFDET